MQVGPSRPDERGTKRRGLGHLRKRSDGLLWVGVFSQPPTVVCKMEAQLDYVVLYTLRVHTLFAH